MLFEEPAIYEFNDYLNRWFAPQALDELRRYQALVQDYRYAGSPQPNTVSFGPFGSDDHTFDLDSPKSRKSNLSPCYKLIVTRRPTPTSGQEYLRWCEADAD